MFGFPAFGNSAGITIVQLFVSRSLDICSPLRLHLSASVNICQHLSTLQAFHISYLALSFAKRVVSLACFHFCSPSNLIHIYLSDVFFRLTERQSCRLTKKNFLLPLWITIKKKNKKKRVMLLRVSDGLNIVDGWILRNPKHYNCPIEIISFFCQKPM